MKRLTTVKLLHVGLVAVLLLAAPRRAAAAQEEAGQEDFTYSVTTTYVTVPVTVTDRDGRPIDGLEASNFTLEDEGKKQEIAEFRPVDLRTPEGRQVAEEIPAAQRSFLLLFDLSFTTTQGLRQARKAALDLIDRAVLAQDLVGVATYSTFNGLNVLVSLTRDQRQLRAAVDRLGLGDEGRRTDPLGLVYDAGIPEGAGPRMSNDVQQGAGPSEDEVDQGTPQSLHRAGAEIEAHLTALKKLAGKTGEESQKTDVLKFVGTLAGLGESLDAVDGRKFIVLLSAGFEDTLLRGDESMLAAIKQGMLVEGGALANVDSNQRFGDATLKREISKALDRLRAADVVIHAVDVSGLGTGSGTGNQDSLFLLANDTGGTLYRNTNDLAGPLAAIAERTSLFYLLGFTPTVRKGPGERHKLAVEVDAHRRGVKVHHRAGYTEPRPFVRMTKLAKIYHAAERLSAGVQSDEIPFSALIRPFAGASGQALVGVAIESPKAFETGDMDGKTGIDVYAYARDEQGRMVDFFGRTLGVDRAKTPENLKGAGLKYFGVFELPPGRYEVPIMLRNAISGKTGLTQFELTVPDFAGGDPYVVAPILFEPAPRWIMAKDDRLEDDAKYPWVFNQQAYVPQVAPIIEKSLGAPYDVAVYVYNVNDAVDDRSLTFEPRLLDAGGAPVEGVLQIAGLAPRSPESKESLFVLKIDPSSLEPGTYTISVHIAHPRTGKEATGETQIVVKG